MSVRPAKTQISLGIRPVWSVFAVRMKKAWVLSYPLSAQRRLWSDWADAQADLSSLGAHSLYWFCHVAAQRRFTFLPSRIPVYQGLCYQCEWLGQDHLWRVKRICVFEHSVMTYFNCACPAIQRGQGSGCLFEGSSWLTACMSEQRRFWRDCADAQARLNLRCSHRR